MGSLLTHPQWPVPIQVRRSGRARRMSLKVDPAQRLATLVLPNRVPNHVAMAFITDHLGWLRARIEALPTPIPFAPGIEIPLLGTPHLLNAAPGARRGVWIENNAIQVSGPPEFFARRTGDFLKAEAKRLILARVEPMAEQLGLPFKTVRIGDPQITLGQLQQQRHAGLLLAAGADAGRGADLCGGPRGGPSQGDEPQPALLVLGQDADPGLRDAAPLAESPWPGAIPLWCRFRTLKRIVFVDTRGAMKTQIARWGNSLAVRLPKQVTDDAGLGEGAAVEIDVVDGVVRVTPAKRAYSLAELLAGITPDNIPESFDDRPRGSELL